MLLPLQGNSSKLYLFFKGTNDLKKKKIQNVISVLKSYAY